MQPPDVQTGRPVLLNGSFGDPVLFVDFAKADDALLFDAGDNSALTLQQLGDVTAVFITHHHVDHFIGFDRIIRANIDSQKRLAVFGPVGTIKKAYDRIKSYEYQFFPFQQIVISVTEVLADSVNVAVLECSKKFPRPVIDVQTRGGDVIYESDTVTVSAGLVDHTVPCLAYSLLEKPQIFLDPSKFKTSGLPAGPWIQKVISLTKAGTVSRQIVSVGDQEHSLAYLFASCFGWIPPRKITYVVDTAWSDLSQPVLLKLADRADLLYCDSFYAKAETKPAAQHRHMLTTQAAELAKAAQVGELIQIHFSQRYAGRYQSLVDEAQAIFPRTSAVLQ